MPVRALFPTFIHQAALQRGGARALNGRILAETRQLRADDAAGRRWSAQNYPGGYTSYGSLAQLHRISPTFEELERKLRPHVRAFTAALQWDLTGRSLAMTDCWVNVMEARSSHSSHLHPLASVSGTYYVRVPRGSPGLKLEDPRLDRFMAAPPRVAGARVENRTWVTLPAVAGELVLFESWLRHEVPANATATPRVSVSFNYNWF